MPSPDEPPEKRQPDDQQRNEDQSGTPKETDSGASDDAPADETSVSAESETIGGDGTEDTDDLPDVEPLTPELVEEEAIRGDFMLRWALVLLAFLLACTPITETPTLVHVKTGQYIASHGWLPPATDVFSYTAAERPWVNLSWLFDLAAAGIFALGGAIGLTIAKALVAAATFGLLVHTDRKDVSSWWGTVCAALALLVGLPLFTALPELITLFGVVLTFSLLHRWQQAGDSRLLWGLPAVFLVWGNLDQRMFLGLALLVLYGAGEGLGTFLGRPGLATAEQRKRLWAVVGASLLAALINPFGWHALAAPFSLYGAEYPALRDYAGAISGRELLAFPVAGPLFWQALNHHAVAGLLLVLAAVIALALNRPRCDPGHLGILLGFAGFALAAAHELAALGLVACIIATVNAQEWYRHTFRQSYSVETSELLFSRGGRAVTVLAFVGIAFLAISGRLDAVAGRRIGVGFAPELRSAVAGVREQLQDAFDDRPFHFRIEQGDILAWLDRRVFLDSRVALYTGSGENDLLDLHDRTRRALRTGEESRPRSARPDVWKATFERFDVTHAMPRLTGPNPDYVTYFDLLGNPNWRLTGLNAAAAVFYRMDLEDSALNDYVADHGLNFAEQAFRQETPPPPERPGWASAPSIYRRYLRLPRRPVPDAVQQARHYHAHLAYALGGRVRLSSPAALALAYLAIRKANEGLAEDPQSAVAYRFLGDTYNLLERLEANVTRSQGGRYQRWLRFYQCVQAYHQSLVIEPDSPSLHDKLFQAYLQRNKFDLALREIREYDRLTAGKTTAELSDRELQRQERYLQMEQRLSEQVDTIRDRVQKALEQEGTNRLAVARAAYQQGCVLEALDILEAEPEFVESNVQARLLKAILLTEAGRSEEAFKIFRKLEALGERYPLPQLYSSSALASLARAQYDHAIDLWNREVDSLQRRNFGSLLQTLPMVRPPQTWPVAQTRATIESLYQMPYEAAEVLFNIAVCQLEAGRNERAAEVFRRLLETNPETSLRPLVRVYLFHLTGERIPLPPPSDRIPVTPDMFASGQEPAVAEQPETD